MMTHTPDRREVALRVLVVEDEALLAAELELVIEESGHLPVGLAASAREALELAERLRPDLETLLYRVTQEALANLARTARTEQRVRIALHSGADAIELRIADDGAGLDAAEQLQPDQTALVGIRQQVELAGGRWELSTRPGGGTTLGVSFDQAGA